MVKLWHASDALVVSFWLLVRNRPLHASAVFALGIIFRDVIMVVYPAFLVALLAVRHMDRTKRIIAAVLPVIAWGTYMFFTWQTPVPRRWILFQVNFADIPMSTNTILSLWLSFGLLWLIALASATLLGGELLKRESGRVILLGGVVAIPLVVITTVTLSLARETRIFFPPFIFIIPLSLWFIQRFAGPLKRFYTSFYGLPGLLWLLLSLRVGWMISDQIYPEGLFRAGPKFTEQLVGVHFGLAIAFFTPILLNLLRDNKQVETDVTLPSRVRE